MPSNNVVLYCEMMIDKSRQGEPHVDTKSRGVHSPHRIFTMSNVTLRAFLVACSLLRVIAFEMKASGSNQQEPRRTGSLEFCVLQWSLREMQSEHLLFSQVANPIPRSFPDLPTYLQAYTWPLVDEVRAQLASGLSSFNDAHPYLATVSSFQPWTSFDKGSFFPPGPPGLMWKARLQIEQHAPGPGRTRQARGGSSSSCLAMEGLKPWDVAIVSEQAVASIKGFDEVPHTLLMVTPVAQVGDSDNVTCMVYAPQGSEMSHALRISQGSGKCWHLYTIGSLATALRVYKALCTAPDSIQLNSSLREALLSNCPGFLATSPASTLDDPSATLNTSWGDFNIGAHRSTVDTWLRLREAVSHECDRGRLNASQAHVVAECSAVACDGIMQALGMRENRPASMSSSNRVKLVQGPPGTGKTSTACCLLRVLAALQARVMVCAPTNVAVQEVAARFLRATGLVGGEDGSSDSHGSRAAVGTAAGGAWLQGVLASAGMMPAGGGMPLRLADVVLVGAQDKVDMRGDMGWVFLPERLKRLRWCCGPQGGFLATTRELTELVHSLKACNQAAGPDHAERGSGQGMARVPEGRDYPSEKPSIDSRGGFLRDKLSTLLDRLCESGRIIQDELPWAHGDRRAWERLGAVTSRARQLLQRRESDEVRTWEAALELLVASTQRTFGDPGASLLMSDARVTERALEEDMGNKSMAQPSLEESLAASIQGLCRDLADERFLALVPGGRRSCPSEEEVLRGARIVFCTVATAGRDLLREKAGVFHTVVVDEAAQLVEAETSILLASTATMCMEQLVLLGDPMQLPATVLSSNAKACGYDRSLFERLQLNGWPVLLLDTQYRMHPDISCWPNLAFYNGRIRDAPSVCSPQLHRQHDMWRAQVLQGAPRAFAFVDVPMGHEEWDGAGNASFLNRLEEVVARGLVRKLTASMSGGERTLKIGIISPYKAQVLRIEEELSTGYAADVQTVDGFQGQERDVIIFSAVRANSSGHVGFLCDHRRLNVAITRARHMCIVLGNVKTLQRDATWRSLIEHARENGLLRSAASEADISLWCRRFLAQQGQMQQLLQPDSLIYATCNWKFVLSAEFVTHVKAMERGPRLETMQRVYNLAAGRWPRQTFQPTQVAPAFQEAIRVVKFSTFCMVWSIDLDTSAATPQQKLRIWDIVHHTRLTAWLKKLQQRYRRFSDSYVMACTPQDPTGRPLTVLPRKFTPEYVRMLQAPPATALGRADQQQGTAALEKSDVENSLSLMKFYTPLPAAMSRLLSSRLEVGGAAVDIELPLDMSDMEAYIAAYPYSCFILGRSGTGKTTVLTQKLLLRDTWNSLLLEGVDTGRANHYQPGSRQVEAEAGPSNNQTRAAHEPGEGRSALRQLVLTVSPKLCAAIKRQLNRAHVAAIMDEPTRMGETWAEEDRDTTEEEEEIIMLDEDDEERLMGDIPNDLTAIEDAQCPLVVTFGKLLAILDGSLQVPFHASRGRLGHHEGQVAGLHALPRMIGGGLAGRVPGRFDRDTKGAEVTYETFASQYWPRFNEQLTKRHQETQVWTEICTHIKGSCDALHDAKGCLSRDRYVALASRRVSTLDEAHREEVYSLFLSYEALRKQRGQYDLADYVFYVYTQYAKGKAEIPPASLMHYVYVDEVQDLCPAQIALLRFVSANVETGFVFAGDTAQTIAKGVGFRFEDIRLLYYTEFLHPAGARSHGAKNQGADERCPDMFQLAQNFRSHRGVVSLAVSIVDLLLRYFPNTLDRLAPECAVVDGEAPVYLEAGPGVNRHVMLHGLVDLETRLFSQVIIVPDSVAKARVKQQVGRGALVLTALESKGLEFKDVLVMDFFHQSPLGGQWRVIYDYMKECGEALDGGDSVHAPKFDATRHAALCPELKKLYVVSTRARQKLAFYDTDATNRAPLQALWEGRGLIRMKSIKELTSYMETQQNTAQDWLRQGELLFSGGKYEDAVLCFQRAGDKGRETWADAALMHRQADLLPVDPDADDSAGTRKGRAPNKEARDLYMTAQQGYLAAARLLPKHAPRLWDKAIACCSKARDVGRLVHICLEVCAPPRPVLAAEHLESAGQLERAFQLYAGAAQAQADVALLSRALRCCVGSCPTPPRGKGSTAGSKGAVNQERYRALLLRGAAEVERYALSEDDALEAADSGLFAASAGEAVPETWDRGYPGASLKEGLETGVLVSPPRILLPPATVETFLRVKADYGKHCALVFKSDAAATRAVLLRFLSWFRPTLSSQREFLRRYQLLDTLAELEVCEGHLEAAAALCERKGQHERASELYRQAGNWEQATRAEVGSLHAQVVWGAGSYLRNPGASGGSGVVDPPRRDGLDGAISQLVKLKDEVAARGGTSSNHEGSGDLLTLEMEALLERARWERGRGEDGGSERSREAMRALWDHASRAQSHYPLMLLGPCMLHDAVVDFQGKVSGDLAGRPAKDVSVFGYAGAATRSLSVSPSENDAMAAQDRATLALTKVWHGWSRFVWAVVGALERQKARTGSKDVDAAFCAANERFLEVWPHAVHTDFFVVPGQDVPWLKPEEKREPLPDDPLHALLHREAFYRQAADFWRGGILSATRHCLEVLQPCLSLGGPFAVTPMNAQSHRRDGYPRAASSRYEVFSRSGLKDFGAVARTAGRLRMLLLCHQLTGFLLDVQQTRSSIAFTSVTREVLGDQAAHSAAGEAVMEAVLLPQLACLEQQGAALGLLRASCQGQGGTCADPSDHSDKQDEQDGSDHKRPISSSLSKMSDQSASESDSPTDYLAILRGIVDEHLKHGLNGIQCSRDPTLPDMSRPVSLDAVARVMLLAPGNLDGQWLTLHLGKVTQGEPFRVPRSELGESGPGGQELLDLRSYMLEAAKHELSARRGLRDSHVGYELSHYGATEIGLRTCLCAYYQLDWCRPGYFSPLVFITLLETYVVMACAVCGEFDGLVLPGPLAVSAMAGHEAVYSVALRHALSPQQKARIQQLLSHALHDVILCMLSRDAEQTVEWLKLQTPTTNHRGGGGRSLNAGAGDATAQGMGSALRGQAEMEAVVILRLVTLALVVGVNAARVGLTDAETKVLATLNKMTNFWTHLSKLQKPPPTHMSTGLRHLCRVVYGWKPEQQPWQFRRQAASLLGAGGVWVSLLCRQGNPVSWRMPDTVSKLRRAVVETSDGMFELPSELVPAFERLPGEDSGCLAQDAHGATPGKRIPQASGALQGEQDSELVAAAEMPSESKNKRGGVGEGEGEGELPDDSNYGDPYSVESGAELSGLEGRPDDGDLRSGTLDDEAEGGPTRGSLDLSKLEGQAAAPAASEALLLPQLCVDRTKFLLAKARKRLVVPLTRQQRLVREVETAKRRLLRVCDDGAGEEGGAAGQAGTELKEEDARWRGGHVLGQLVVPMAGMTPAKIALYMSVFKSGACPALANAEDALPVLSRLILKLSERSADGVVVDALYDREEELKGFLSESGDGLSPANDKKHAALCIQWLQSRARELNVFLRNLNKEMERANEGFLEGRGLPEIKAGRGV
eukprot:jgi/Mesvir1/5911/Mv00680-RA.1